jgi:uncharacterized protein (TIGR00375 family)
MDLENISLGAAKKGLGIMGTGDFTHPKWFQELREKLEGVDDSGLFKLKGSAANVLFMLTAEVSTIASTPKGVKKVHHVVHAPSFDDVEAINERYAKLGNLAADGRPTIGNCTPAEFAEVTFEACGEAAIVPAHAWTPWFSVFGSNSGYDSLEEAYGDQAHKIFAIETGMSSDPAMNWRLSKLDRIALMSNSDAHSSYPWRLGRECNAFELGDPSYKELFEAVRKKDRARFLFTIETSPSYGKYHYDGHRLCNFSCSPSESAKRNKRCPVCGRMLTIGVLNRVEELADRPEGFVPPGAIPFRTLLPLHELLAAVYGTQAFSKRVSEEGDRLFGAFGNEFNVLLNASREDLLKYTDKKIAEVILLNRDGKIKVAPGYDGVYGVPVLEDEYLMFPGKKAKKERPAAPVGEAQEPQKGLGEFLG